MQSNELALALVSLIGFFFVACVGFILYWEKREERKAKKKHA